MSKRNYVVFVFVVLFASFVFAHTEDAIPVGSVQESLHIRGYDITFVRSEKLRVGDVVQFVMEIIDPEGNMAEGMDVQGQILDPDFGKEVFYASVFEVAPARYAFEWKPSFAGEYVVQFIFRSAGDEILQPSFAIRIEDSRAEYAFVAGIVSAILCFVIGLYASLPRKNKKFCIASLFISLVLGIIFIGAGLSVAYFYNEGGERGFVVCGVDGCVLAVHWHSQLEMSVCGKPYYLPLESGDLNRQHTHKERNKLHIHTTIKTDETGTELLEPEKIRVGELFDQLKIRFTNECFAEYCNNDSCPGGEPGKLRMRVNNAENKEFSKYTWNDGDSISIIFE